MKEDGREEECRKVEGRGGIVEGVWELGQDKEKVGRGGSRGSRISVRVEVCKACLPHGF